MNERRHATASPRFRSILGLVVVSLLVLLALGGLRTYRDLDKARGREAALRQELVDSRERAAGLKRRIESLKTDPLVLEKLAREELGMVKPGEVVILVGEEPPPAAAEPESAPAPPAR